MKSSQGRTGADTGFTLVEMMISMAASAVMLGALLLSSLSIQRAVFATDKFAGNYSDQRRLIDYISRDMRRAVALSATDPAGVRHPLQSGSMTITGAASLIVTLPGYYRSDVPGSSDYDQALAVVGTESRLDYGSSAGIAPTVEVIFRKLYLTRERCVCFVREENGRQEVIVRAAEGLETEVSLAQEGRAGFVKTSFRSMYGRNQPVISTFDELLLRNAPLDMHP